jgi:hypothetical protein
MSRLPQLTTEYSEAQANTEKLWKELVGDRPPEQRIPADPLDTTRLNAWAEAHTRFHEIVRDLVETARAEAIEGAATPPT